MGIDSPIVYAVDDEAAIRKLLRLMLTSAGFTVETYESGDAFLAEYDPQRAGCLILDLQMETMTGLELFTKLQEESSDLPVIFLTGHGDVDNAVHAKKLGAFDFLEKPFDSSRLIDRVRQAVQQRVNPSDQRLEVKAISTKLQSLTESERHVLRLVAEGKSSKQIAVELHRSRRTIENHRHHIMQKMNASSAGELVRMATLVSVNNPGVFPGN